MCPLNLRFLNVSVIIKILKGVCYGFVRQGKISKKIARVLQ